MIDQGRIDHLNKLLVIGTIFVPLSILPTLIAAQELSCRVEKVTFQSLLKISVTAKCSPGYQMTGGGFSIDAQPKKTKSLPNIEASFPAASNKGWQCKVSRTTSPIITGQCYAVCCKILPPKAIIVPLSN